MAATLNLLRIKNLALVEDLQWELAPGFTAITGETGAGKSIIIGALQLLLGERADKGLIRTGADLCTVEAVFEGDRSAVEQAVAWSRGGPPSAIVTSVDVTPETPTGERGFGLG